MIHRQDMLCDSFLKCVYIYLDLSSRNLSRVKTDTSDNDKEDLYIHESGVCVCLPEDTAEGLSEMVSDKSVQKRDPYSYFKN